MTKPLLGDDEHVDPVAFNMAFDTLLSDLPHMLENALPPPSILRQLLDMHPNPKIDLLHLPVRYQASLAFGALHDINITKWHYHPWIQCKPASTPDARNKDSYFHLQAPIRFREAKKSKP